MAARAESHLTRTKTCHKGNYTALHIPSINAIISLRRKEQFRGILCISLIVSLLHSNHGDSILICVSVDSTKPFRILVDGGTGNFSPKTAAENYTLPLARASRFFRGQRGSPDLVVMTHVRDDHIGELLKASELEKYQKVLGADV